MGRAHARHAHQSAMRERRYHEGNELCPAKRHHATPATAQVSLRRCLYCRSYASAKGAPNAQILSPLGQRVPQAEGIACTVHPPTTLIFPYFQVHTLSGRRTSRYKQSRTYLGRERSIRRQDTLYIAS